MHKSNNSAFFNINYLIIDVLVLILSYFLSYTIASEFSSLYNICEYIWILVLYVPVWTVVMGIKGMYNNTTFNYFDRIFVNILYSSILATLVLSASMYVVKETYFSRIFFFTYCISAFLITLIVKYFVLYVVKVPTNKNTKQVIVIGTDSMYQKFNYFMEKTNIKINIVDYICVNGQQPISENKSLMDAKTFQESLKYKVVDEIYFLLPLLHFDEIQRYVIKCEEMGITTRILMDFDPIRYSRIHVASLGTLPMITLHSVSLNNFQLFIKRVIDIGGALVGLLLSSFLWIGAAIAIKVNSKGPIFYTQKRMGRNGRIFKLYKFRSMYIDADERKKELEKQNEMSSGLMFKLKDDPRITSVGKFIRKTSIDELPQFFNVLKGDMSLVGTRPPTIDEVEQYDIDHIRRISIKPGITGMWQVSGRSTITDFDDVVTLDTKYIDKWSVKLDIQIILKTILVVFTRRGAS